MIHAGTLRHRITIQQPIDGPSSTLTWSTFATIRAELQPLTSRELFSLQALDTAVSHRVRTRWRSGVTADMRLVLGTRTFRIVGPPLNVEERNRDLELLVEEIL